MGKKILYISGSIGLGHVIRDLAIVKELRKIKPSIDIHWLAEEPVITILKEAGETVIPELYSEYNLTTNKFADDDNRFNMMKFMYSFSKFWKKGFENFRKIIDRQEFDFVIGDEAYEIAMAFAEGINYKHPPMVMMWDFVKFYPMTRSPMELLIAWMSNRAWHKAYKHPADPNEFSIFFGVLEDIPDEKFGMFLVNCRDWARKFCKFVGYPVPFDPKEYADSKMMKEKLGYGKEPLIICSIGGTAVGRGLLRLCANAYPYIKKEIPDVRMILVAGPAVPLDSLNISKGAELRGYVPKLYEHFAASDLAIVLGGGSSTLELTALQKPFLYFPLEYDSEQMISVNRVVERHNAGIKMLYSKTTPEELAKQVVANIGKKVDYPDIPIDGVRKSAELIAQFI